MLSCCNSCIHKVTSVLRSALLNGEYCVCICAGTCISHLILPLLRIVTGNNTNNKSESDQEDNDDVNDNDWSYGAEKKGDPLVLILSPTLGSCALFVTNGLIPSLITLWNNCILNLLVLLSQPKKGNLTRYSLIINTVIFLFQLICLGKHFLFFHCRIQTRPEDPNHLSIKTVSHKYHLLSFDIVGIFVVTHY